jgi:hypothetical protein
MNNYYTGKQIKLYVSLNDSCIYFNIDELLFDNAFLSH